MRECSPRTKAGTLVFQVRDASCQTPQCLGCTGLLSRNRQLRNKVKTLTEKLKDRCSTIKNLVAGKWNVSGVKVVFEGIIKAHMFTGTVCIGYQPSKSIAVCEN